MEFPVSSLLFTDFYFLLPSDKFTPSTVLNTRLVSPDKGCYQERGGAGLGCSALLMPQVCGGISSPPPLSFGLPRARRLR